MIKDSLYGKYIQERQGAEILENDFGFIIYKLNIDECFIIDMGVDFVFRKNGKGSELLATLEKVAALEGCKYISANIHISDPGHKNTVIAALLAGFKIIKAEVGILVIVKEILGGK